jgi:hypothetical protein
LKADVITSTFSNPVYSQHILKKERLTSKSI